MSPYQIVFGKVCHLPTVKQCNIAYDQAGKERKLQLQELEELHLEVYENSQIYKKKVKQFHDSQILRKYYKQHLLGQQASTKEFPWRTDTDSGRGGDCLFALDEEKAKARSVSA
ncbi:hypothetical protein CR513_40350, partial [Mucuna pruriens]